MNQVLIRLAVNEWALGKLTGEAAMFRIAIVAGIKKPPSKECTDWAKQSIMEQKKCHGCGCPYDAGIGKDVCPECGY